ncbi:MAG: NAD-dependent epimerase/dehydratase family protein [Chloroflexi bacterium]|nr:NAD-dependent epimerase/dehydratase family protein [Chloroflexota bacterium]
MTSRRVLVTGGAGFVGSHLVDALCAHGDDVVVVDDLSTGDRANVPDGVAVRVVDISDGPALGRAIEGAHFDAVVHCAAKTKVVQSAEQPELYRRVIVDGTRNVVDAALATGARDLVNISTGGAIYGETPTCAHEDSPLSPVSPYGRFKAEAEAIVQRHGLRGISLRLGNAYGPRQRDDLEGGVISIFLGALRDGRPLTIFGDGSAERDYVYVGDVADAVLAALDASATGIYNIGTGVATSVNALVDLMRRVLGASPEVQHAPARAAEIQRSCLDVSKAARDGLWRPRTTLEDGLGRTARSMHLG